MLLITTVPEEPVLTPISLLALTIPVGVKVVSACNITVPAVPKPNMDVNVPGQVPPLVPPKQSPSVIARVPVPVIPTPESVAKLASSIVAAPVEFATAKFITESRDKPLPDNVQREVLNWSPSTLLLGI